MSAGIDAGAAWQAIRRGSRSFAAASRLLAPETRQAAWLLYAWCRYCDDRIDGEQLGRPSGTPGGRAALDALRESTHAALRGEPMADPVFAGLQRVVREHAIPHSLPLELLDGFAMDVDRRRYVTLDDVVSYSYHVAGTVGLMMAHLMGVREGPALERASALGIALQLTNIARDVMEDARAGRVYLPEAWLDQAGVDRERVADPASRAAVAAVVRRLLEAGDAFYRAGDAGIARLPFRSAWAVTVARGVYSEIGALVRRRGLRAWDRRAIVSRPRKLAWVARGLARAAWQALGSRFGRQPSAMGAAGSRS